MMATLLALRLLLLLAATATVVRGAVTRGGVHVPTYTEPCRRTSPSFNGCIQKALQALIPKLGKKGIPEIELETIDPLYVPEMVFNYESLPDIGGKLTVSDTRATGLGAIKITDVRSKIVESKSFAMDIDFMIKRIVVIGQFSMNGRVGQYPVSGSGAYNLTTGQVTGTWKLRGVPLKQSGEDYIKLINFRTSPSLGYFKIHADNLVHGNPALSSTVVAFVNRFWQLLYNQSLPYFERNFNTLGKEFLNKIFLKIPFDQLFPR